jgi:hypothetical protein
MGKLTELHNYLRVPEDRLERFKMDMAYLRVTEDLKKLRKELGYYKEG